MATAGYINSDTEQIRANIESRKNRLAEKERKEQEDAKQRFIDYWASHSEEKIRLQSEKSELGEKIQSMKASLQNQITDLNNQLNKSPLITELSKLEERIAIPSFNVAESAGIENYLTGIHPINSVPRGIIKLFDTSGAERQFYGIGMQVSLAFLISCSPDKDLLCPLDLFLIHTLLDHFYFLL